MHARLLKGIFVCLVIVSLFAACAPAASPTISIEGAKGKPSMTMPTAGAMFMIIKNTGTASDRLMSGKSPACGSIEVHESVMKSDGTMGMNLIDKPVEIPAGGQIELKSGGMHIMCIMKNDQFKPGTKVNLTLVFEKSGEKTFSVELGE